MPTETGPLIVTVDDGATTLASTILTLEHTITSGNGGNGIGSLLEFKAENATGTSVISGDICGLLTDATNGKGALAVRTRTGGSLGERMRIDDSGNVGIGTTSPVRKLTVVGGIASGEGTGSDTDGRAELLWDSSNDNASLSAYQGGYKQLRIEASPILLMTGSVGIGTVAPLTRLHLAGSAGGLPATSGTTPTALFAIENSSSVSSLYFGTDNSDPYGSWIQAADSNALGTYEELLLNPRGGNVGIGTTAPSYTTHVVKDASGGADILALENSSNDSNETKFAGIVFRGKGAGTTKDAAYVRAYPDGTDYASSTLRFSTRNSGSIDERWRITKEGILQAKGSQTIQAENALTLATLNNSNLLLKPDGAGMVALGEASPTNLLHVSKSACEGIDLIAAENSSSGDCLTKFAGLAFRGRDTTSQTGKYTGYLRAYPQAADYNGSRLSFWSRFSSTVMAERMAIGAMKNLTDEVATTLFKIDLPDGTSTGGMVLATIEADNGTNRQTLTQLISFAAVKITGTAPTMTVTVNSSSNASAYSSGSFTSVNWAFVHDSGNNKIEMRVTVNSDLGSITTFRVTYTVFNHSSQALTFV